MIAFGSFASPGHESDRENSGKGRITGPVSGLVKSGLSTWLFSLPRLGLDPAASGGTGFPSLCLFWLSGREWKEMSSVEGGSILTEPVVFSRYGENGLVSEGVDCWWVWLESRDPWLACSSVAGSCITENNHYPYWSYSKFFHAQHGQGYTSHEGSAAIPVCKNQLQNRSSKDRHGTASHDKWRWVHETWGTAQLLLFAFHLLFTVSL